MTQLFSGISLVQSASLKYLPHLEQLQYSLLPAVVQVAPTASWCVR